MHPEIFARLAPLPAKVKAVTVTDDNLVFNVFVSEYLCERSRLAALNHELNHIYENQPAVETHRTAPTPMPPPSRRKHRSRRI